TYRSIIEIRGVQEYIAARELSWNLLLGYRPPKMDRFRQTQFHRQIRRFLQASIAFVWTNHGQLYVGVLLSKATHRAHRHFRIINFMKRSQPNQVPQRRWPLAKS